MGVSTDGTLVFGVDFDEELPDAFQGYEDFDLGEQLAEENGIPDWSPEFEAEYGYCRWKKIRELEEACPVDVYHHCSDSCTMYIFFVRGHRFTAYRGYPEEIKVSDMEVPREKIDAFMEWMSLHDIECKEPVWLLTSYWG